MYSEMKILYIFLCLLTYASGDLSLVFRADYSHIRNLNSYFKIHTEHKTWSLAKRICIDEGATLLHPGGVGDALEFITALSFLNQSPHFDWLSNGISELITQPNETLDGIPISEVYNDWESDVKEYPFICKKTEKSLDMNYDCNLGISGYNYSRELARCYKFHQYPRNWTDSRDVCKNERSYLAILNSAEENQYFRDLAKKMALDFVYEDSLHPFPPGPNSVLELVYLGFHNPESKGWKTVQGTKLEDTGYTPWGAYQPSGQPRELCGAMYYNGDLNDFSCDKFAFFICEHEINYAL